MVDVSGDGANNSGGLVTLARDELVASGITINGLPILLKRPNSFTMDIENLDVYFEDCVIGGPGAFVIPIRDRSQFKDATRTKLVLEIAGHTPPAQVIPAQARTAAHLLQHRRTDVARTLGQLTRSTDASRHPLRRRSIPAIRGRVRAIRATLDAHSPSPACGMGCAPFRRRPPDRGHRANRATSSTCGE